MSSIPTEIRTRPSVMPMAARRSGGTEAWVIVAGCEISVSTPPEAFGERHEPDAVQHRARALERSHVEGQHAAEPLHLARGERVLRMVRQPGIVDLPHLRMPREILGDRLPVSVVRLHAHGHRLRAAQHQPRVERAQDGARRVLHEPEPLDVVLAHRDRRCRRCCRCGRSGTSSCCARRGRRRRRSAAAGSGWRTCCRRRAGCRARAPARRRPRGR